MSHPDEGEFDRIRLYLRPPLFVQRSEVWEYKRVGVVCPTPVPQGPTDPGSGHVRTPGFPPYSLVVGPIPPLSRRSLAGRFRSRRRFRIDSESESEEIPNNRRDPSLYRQGIGEY